MPKAFMTDIDRDEMLGRLERVRYVFTDLDGTMLGPGSSFIRAASGEPSLAFLETLIALGRAGVEVIPATGRNRAMIHEDARVIGLNSYIAEMGGIIMVDAAKNEWEYFTADMPYNPAWGYTPHQCIEATGILEEFCDRWPGLLEYHNDMSTGYKYREVTVGMRGEIPDEDARALIAAHGAELDWGDNGYLNYISKPTTLDLPEGVRGRAYNLSPKGLDKGRAIERFCELRGIDPADAVALGDSSADFLMADHVGTFIMVENALEVAAAPGVLASHDNAFVTRGRMVDGWVAAMRLVLEAKGAALPGARA